MSTSAFGGGESEIHLAAIGRSSSRWIPSRGGRGEIHLAVMGRSTFYDGRRSR